MLTHSTSDKNIQGVANVLHSASMQGIALGQDSRKLLRADPSCLEQRRLKEPHVLVPPEQS